MDKNRNTAEKELLNDDLLDAVSGGQSLYDTSDDISRESWFVRLVTKLMGEREGAPNLPLSAQQNEAAAAVVGKYGNQS